MAETMTTAATKTKTSVTIKARPLAGGRVSWFLYFRPALPDGTTLLRVDGFDKPEDRPHVEAFAKPYREALAGVAAKPKPESADEWYERFKAYRAKEVGSAEDDAWRWSKWVSPHIGPKPIRDVTPDDIENVRDALTAAVLAYEAAGNMKGEGRLAPKTALHVWSALVIAMKYASTKKGPRELRVREDRGNPCLGIPPPRNGASKRRQWLRPVQWSKLIAWLAPRDRAWAEAYAVGLYLHLRPGELHELRVKDLVLADGDVRICRAFDEREKVVTTPKTDEGIRTVTIPATLLPLLERIARERGAEDRVCPIVAATPEKSRAGIFREFLEAASAGDPSFFVETATHLPIDFRGALRDSGITWRFLAGHRAEVVQRESGHEHIATTLGYAKEVQDRGARYGEPFPALAAELVGPTPRAVAPTPVTALVCEPRRRDRSSDVARRGLRSHAAPQPSEIAHAATPSNPASPTNPPAEAPRNTDVSGAPRSPFTDRSQAPGTVDASAPSAADLGRLAAKARVIAALASGDVRALAGELATELGHFADLAAPGADVVPLASRRR